MRDDSTDFLREIHSVYFTGIKGVGMTALALCFDDLGIKISGSDIQSEFVTDSVLQKRNIKWKTGFDGLNISLDTDLLITTAAHGGLNNPEVLYAKQKNIPVLTYAEVLAKIANVKKVIGVCGVGGKTSTSSIIATIFDRANLNPSYVVGVGNIFPLGVPGHYSKDSEYFICESDDYVISPGIDNRPKFDLINHKILVVTNIEYDHPDVYQSFDDTKKAFRRIFEKIPDDGLLVACIDNPHVRQVIKGLLVPIATYGFSKDADYQIINYKIKDQKAFCEIKNGNNIYTFKLSVPGKYNALNGLAGFIVSEHVGIAIKDIIEGLEFYKGCRRRFELIKTEKDITYIDDYAHHPEEVVNTIKAAKEWFPKRRVVTIFQPHTYSRTKALFEEFTVALSNSDVLVLVDIFASAREEKDESVSSELLANKIRLINNNTYYIGNVSDISNWITQNVRSNDVVITMGAGDIYKYYEENNK